MFTSKRKKKSTIIYNIDDSSTNNNERLHTIGESESVLKLCSHYFDQLGEKRQMDKEMREKIVSDAIEEYAQRGLRTVCLAYRDLEVNEGGEEHSNEAKDGIHAEIETNGLTFNAIIGMRDVLRPDVINSVNIWHQAGIWVRMITGDNKSTALSIAKECGIVDIEEDAVLEGKEFAERVGGLICENCNQNIPCACLPHEVKESIKYKDECNKTLQNLRVLAKSRPEDKYLLVRGLQLMGDVVAVTGDGTNDAPALKRADVGFWMGISGTDVAKRASSIILLDDNFSSIVKACKWGRNIYLNMRKVLQFQLTLNLVTIAILSLSAIFFQNIPIKPIQILWMNVIINFIVSYLFINESPSSDFTADDSTKDENLINGTIIKHIIIGVIYQVVVLIILIFVGDKFIPESSDYYPRQSNGDIVTGRYYTFGGDSEYRMYINGYGPCRQYTVVYTVFAIFQLINILNSRKLNNELNMFAGIVSTKLFLSVWFWILVVHVLVTQFLPAVIQLNKEGMTFLQWVISLLLGFSILLFYFISNFIQGKLWENNKSRFGKMQALSQDIEMSLVQRYNA